MRRVANDIGPQRERERVLSISRASETQSDEERAAEEALLLAFAPLYKRAFGIAMGIAGALIMFTLTGITLLRDEADRFPLGLLSEYFYGYELSWIGLLIGTLWGFAVGFVAGWFIAFCRNLALAISVFAIRTRAELSETRDFLDHI